jgi:methylthioribose-1-phosphate isomerase
MTEMEFHQETVALDEEAKALVIIDQTKLPGRIEMLSLTKVEDVWEAIYQLKVRGAPAIGVAAAIGIYVAAVRFGNDGIAGMDVAMFRSRFRRAKEYLETSRPTAVNLFWALNRMEGVVTGYEGDSVVEILRLLHDEAVRIHDEDIEVCRKIGEHALTLVCPGDGLLTHCNAGRLAAVKYGTATAPMYLGQERGYRFRIYADETRPLLQGARLTAFELQAAGMDVTLVCDGMSSALMQKGLVDAVFVGCDRVAANGDVANKIGTSVVACVAKQYGVPVYVCAPTSTIDMAIKSGTDIPIEERAGEEVTEMWYRERMAPEGVKVWNPCFDVTSHELIAGIVTENGIVRAPYEKNLPTVWF